MGRQPGGALERLVGKGKAGMRWGEMVRRVAQVRGGKAVVMGRVVRVGSGSRCSKPLGDWEGGLRILDIATSKTKQYSASGAKVAVA